MLMNLYDILPLIAFFSNLIVGYFVFYRDTRNKINISYAFLAFSVAIWSLGDFLVHASKTSQTAIFWDKLSTAGALIFPFFLLLFFLFFTKTKSISRKKIYLLFLPTLIFELIAIFTNGITGGVRYTFFGFVPKGGIFYIPFILYIITYILTSLIISYKFYIRSRSVKKRIQSKLLIISILIPLVGGILTEVIPTILKITVFPLSSSLSTITSLIIAYAIIKHGLMTPTTFTIGRKTLLFFTILSTLIILMSIVGIYNIKELNESNEKMIEHQRHVLIGILHIKNDVLRCDVLLDKYSLTEDAQYIHDLNYILDDMSKRVSIIENESPTKHLEDVKDFIIKYRNGIEAYKNGKFTMHDVMSISDSLVTSLDLMYNIENEKLKGMVDTNKKNYLNSVFLMLVFTIILISIGGIFVFSISRSIIIPIIKITKTVSRVSKGDFDQRINIKSKDEIGELVLALNQMIKDLSKFKEESEKHSKELEHKVRMRTRELSKKVKQLTKTRTALLNMMEDMEETNKKLKRVQKELKKSMKELKESDIKKNEFISIAAHELKTPLTSIHGFAQLLQNPSIFDDYKKSKKYLKIMEHETKRLAKLVNDILNLSRIDLGTIKLYFEKVDVKEIVDEVKREMESLIKKNGLKSEYYIEEGLPKIITDRSKLIEVLINLINNSVKYTPKGKIIVNVFKDGDSVHFIVKDTGIGISRSNQKKVFGRFYQVDSSLSRKVGGTGLGLSLCKEYIELLGGRIWLKSKLGKGSEFHFTLPINRQIKK
ncbi:MAG: HAMP domain-containing protein [Candidatus Aenigmarchaeota archaeon]|nr:HAMP domain-containing protein [Candidatus Aenigmarchaeota archaeon]